MLRLVVLVRCCWCWRCRSGYAVAACKAVTLTVDGTAMQVTTIKIAGDRRRRSFGFSVDDRDDLYPAAGVQVHDAGDTIVLRRSRRCRSRWIWSRRAKQCGRPVDGGRAGPTRDDRHGAGTRLRQPRPAVRDGATGRQRQDGAAQRRRVVRTVRRPQCRGAAEVKPACPLLQRPRGAHAATAIVEGSSQVTRNRIRRSPSGCRCRHASCRGRNEHEPEVVEDPGFGPRIGFAVAEVNGVEDFSRCPSHSQRH